MNDNTRQQYSIWYRVVEIAYESSSRRFGRRGVGGRRVGGRGEEIGVGFELRDLRLDQKMPCQCPELIKSKKAVSP
jgi:hypothetical protein